MQKRFKKLGNFIRDFAKSPVDASAQIRRYLLRKLPSANAARLRTVARQSLLVLQIETTNICNAACVFCAYSHMKRNKGVMSLPLFEKVVNDYVAMGGGPVSLTPIMGDALLDPYLLERLRILRMNPEINQITLTTNAIALDRYSDEEVSLFLQSFYSIAISIGGLDADTYKQMYGVDRFSEVYQNVERLLKLRSAIKQPAHIHVAFRTNNCRFTERFQPQLDEYRRRGVCVSHISTYANYTGVVTSNEGMGLVVKSGGCQKHNTCVLASISMCVCWDGRITVCGCADFDGNLMIGHAANDSLSDVWRGEKRAAILDSFGKKALPQDCYGCTAYQPDSIFAYPFFKGVQPHKPLPLDFFQQFWGG